MIAALNHPNICTLYDVGPNYLVMEYIEGTTPRGPLPVDEALRIGRQVADALEAAHERGIVHRDLKPGNILIRSDGTVKVLDFGLAKVVSAAAAGSEKSPTITMGASQAGNILGTAAYMSPEQARGQDVDSRADIWSFGVLLCELVSGRPVFAGPTVSDTLASVLKAEPNLTAIPPVLRSSLDAACARTHASAGAASATHGLRLKKGCTWDRRRLLERGRAITPWVIMSAVLAVASVAGWLVAWRATRSVDHPLTRVSVDLGPDAVTGLNVTAAISPDGRRLVFSMKGTDGKARLTTRLLDQPRPVLLPGTENGRDPFFSPDAQWIGFFAGGQLKKTSVQGGAPVMLGSFSGCYTRWRMDRGRKYYRGHRRCIFLCPEFLRTVDWRSRLASLVPVRSLIVGRRSCLVRTPSFSPRRRPRVLRRTRT